MLRDTRTAFSLPVEHARHGTTDFHWVRTCWMVMGQWLRPQWIPYMARVTQHLLTCGEQVTKIWSTNLHCADVYSLAEVKRLCDNLQANVSATVRLFGGDSSHTPFFDWQRFQDNTLYPLAIIHMEHINVPDFDDKSERNLCFSFGNSGIIFNGASAQLFPPRDKW